MYWKCITWLLSCQSINRKWHPVHMLFLCLWAVNCDILNFINLSPDVYDLEKDFVVVFDEDLHRVIKRKNNTFNQEYYMKVPQSMFDALHMIYAGNRDVALDNHLINAAALFSTDEQKRLFFYRCIADMCDREFVQLHDMPSELQLAFYRRMYPIFANYENSYEFENILKVKVNWPKYDYCNDDCDKQCIRALMHIYDDMIKYSHEYSLDLINKIKSEIFSSKLNRFGCFPPVIHLLESTSGIMKSVIRVLNGFSCSFYFRMDCTDIETLKGMLSNTVTKDVIDSVFLKQHFKWLIRARIN